MGNLDELLSELSKNNRFEELLIQCLNLLLKRVDAIFFKKKKHANRLSKFQDNENSALYFENITKMLVDSTNIEVITTIKKNLMDTKDISQLEKMFQVNINQVMEHFSDIYNIYGFITFCCIELKCTKTLIYYLNLSHNILPCFIIGDLLFAKINMVEKWNTEKVLISSMAKVSMEIFQDDNSKILGEKMNELYISWTICLDNLLEYVKTRLIAINYSQRNVSEEVIGMIEFIKELFQLISRSNLPCHYQILLVFNCCESLSIFNALNSNQIPDLFEDPSLSKVNMLSEEIEDDSLNGNINRILKNFIKYGMHRTIIDLMTIVNGLSTLLINIIHQGMKELNSTEIDINLSTNDFCVNPIKGYSLKFEKKKIVIIELHYLKAHLSILNQLLLKRLMFYDHLINKSNRIIFDQRYQKVLINYLFLTIGIIHSFSKVELDGHLISILNFLFDSQCFILENILSEKWSYDNVFLKNIDSYRSSLLEYTTKQLFFLGSKDKMFDSLCKNCIDKILKILSLFLEFQGEPQRFKSKEKIEIVRKINIKFKTSICEVVLRSIQYMDGISEELFIKMEDTISQILNTKYVEGSSNIDEVILNFLISISENLIRLSSRLKSKKKYQDSVKLLNLALKCLTNTLSVPWIATDESIYEIEKSMEMLKISQDSPKEDGSEILYSTPIRKYNPTEQGNNLLNNDLLCLTNNVNNNTCARFWINENLQHNNATIIKGSVKEIKAMNSFLPNSTVQLANTVTPFTQRLKSKGLSQLRSQTIKRIQTSALAYISKSKSKYGKIEDIEILKLNQELKEECELDFPIHILLFLIALEQFISSVQLGFLQDSSQDSLNNILTTVEENLSIFFTLIDNRSYSFIFRNKLIELFPFIGDLDIIFNLAKSDEFEKATDDDKQLINDHFFNLFSSIVTRYAKVKIILINEFTVNEAILFRYPVIKNKRNSMFRMLWLYLELNYYIHSREVSNKCNQLFKKGVISGFCTNIVDIYKVINEFIDEKATRHLITYSKTNLELYFNIKKEFLNYYLWLIKNIFNIQTENFDLVELKTSYISETNMIIDELTQFMEKLSNNNKCLYLLRINIYKIHLLFFEDNLTFSTITTANLSQTKNNKIHMYLEESLDLFYKYIRIHEKYKGQSYHELLCFEFWKNSEKGMEINSYLGKAKTQHDESEIIINELEDVPIPINNRLNRPIKIENECGSGSDTYKKERKNVNKNSVRFVENELLDNIHQVKMGILQEIGLNELEMIFSSTFEIFEVINLQDIDTNLLKKWIGATLYLFSSCWIFILNIDTNDTLADKENLSKKINYSLNELISNLKLSFLKNEQKEMLTFNIGLFISNNLHYLTQTMQTDLCDSNESISAWSNVTNIYLDGLIYLIECKYLLSSDFIDEKVSIPLPIVEILFNLIVLKVEHVNTLHEASQCLEIINKIGIDEITKDNQYNSGLFIRVLTKLSTLFMYSNKPDLSLFYSLEANKYTQVLMLYLETCNVMTICSQCNLISTCLSHNSQLYFVNLILKSLFQLGEFWWRLGVIERSQSVYNKLVSFYKKWTIPYKKLLIFYFYQLPTLLNHLFSRSDSQFNIIYSIDNIDLFKQILYEENVYTENSSHIHFFKEILEHARVISGCKCLSYSEEKVILMILLFILAYFNLNDALSVIRDYIDDHFSFIIQDNKSYLPENNHKIIQSLRKIINKLLRHKLNPLNLFSELYSLSSSECLSDHHFIFFLNNTTNYTLLFISSKYIEMIGNYFINKKSKEGKDAAIIILENEFVINKKFVTTVNKNSIEFTIKEICSLVVLIKQMLFIELTPIETYLISIDYNNKLDRTNGNFLNDKSFGKYELALINQLNENNSNKNRLQLFKQILIFINVIFNHILLNENMNYYLLNQLSISIILDIVLLMKVLSYPDDSWNNLFCCFINSLTPISIFSDHSFSIIHSIRKIQKEFEHYKISDKTSAVCLVNGNFQSSLLKFFLENKTDDLSEWGWGEYVSNKDIGDTISIAFIRFSTFFANSTFKSSNYYKYSLLQITKDCSFDHSIYEANSNEKKITLNSSKLTLLYFIENSRINELLEEFDVIQHLNTESIVKIDTNINSGDQARKWWNRRISIETTLNNWLIKFSNLILKGWMAKLFYGRRKDLNTKENIKQVSDFVKDCLIDVTPSVIDIILFSLSNNVPQVLNLLSSNNILNIDLSEIYNNFKKIKFQPSKNKIENFPVVIFLDRMFVCLPIESLHDLRYQPITRGIGRRFCKSNMDYLFGKAQKCKDNSSCLLAEFCNLYYCINPTGDLEETEKIIVSFIKQKFGSKCSGISNSIPQATVIMNNISTHQSNLYLFCGHQAGEKFMQGEAFERGIAPESSEDEYRFHVPPSLLIGCSSSKIRSYGSNNIFFTPLHYLIGGSPFVLGALWDVTDQDIDRFTMSIFDHWVGSKLSLIESITLAKQECKLPLLNGSSCVCFGYPI